jgi:hypothetical protein
MLTLLAIPTFDNTNISFDSTWYSWDGACFVNGEGPVFTLQTSPLPLGFSRTMNIPFNYLTP